MKEKKMRAALVIVPKLDCEIDQAGYLRDCMKIVQKEGYLPFCPNIYKQYTSIEQESYAKKVMHIIDAVFLFVDFGADETMLRIAQLFDEEMIRRKTLKPRPEKYEYALPHILHQVSKMTGISIEELKSKSRKREVVDARFVYYRHARATTRESLARIGKLVKRDHSGVVHGIREAHQVKEVKDLYQRCFNQLTQETA